MLNEAKQICSRALATLTQSGEEKPEKYHKLMDSIDFYSGYEEKYQRNLETLKKYPKEELFTITGRNFYKNNIALTPNMPLRLVREPDNEFDSDAIAVYAENEKIGYVANKDYTKFELTSKASELRGKVQDTGPAEYLLYLDRYAEIQFSIGRISKDD